LGSYEFEFDNINYWLVGQFHNGGVGFGITTKTLFMRLIQWLNNTNTPKYDILMTISEHKNF